eukprot:TRINITY_DN795_c0_g1_i1.p1 TRINITY_DN795_c0_g1~~TRINITY_DN795_c0_g1_i1.p1  ORF type:complete len:348 (+),score=70.67 TRINITY_DN795_c0_g1_i1:73-1044(+)
MKAPPLSLSLPPALSLPFSPPPSSTTPRSYSSAPSPPSLFSLQPRSFQTHPPFIWSPQSLSRSFFGPFKKKSGTDELPEELKEKDATEIYVLGQDLMGKKQVVMGLRYWMLAREKGSQEAQFSLAQYALADGVSEHDANLMMQGKNPVDDLIALHEVGFMAATGALSHVYFFGIGGTRVDVGKARDCAEKAANAGMMSGATCLIQIAQAEGDVGEVIRSKKRAADLGHSIYQFEYGMMLIEGRSPEYCEGDDVRTGLMYLRKAADAANLEASYNLGKLCLEGRLETQDVKKAMFHLQFAAQRQFLPAKFKLGQIYDEGSHSAS